MQYELASLRHGVDGVTHQVGEHLPQFAGKSPHRAGCVQALLDFDVSSPDLRRVQNEHALHYVGKVNLNRIARLAMEGQQLSGDLGDARQLVAGHRQILG